MKSYKLTTYIFIALLQIPVFVAVWQSQYLFGVLDKFANLTGFVGAIMMITGFVLGNRQIVKWFSSDLNWFLGVHKWLGIIGGFVALAHPILEMMAFVQTISFVFIPDFSNQFEVGLSYGRIGLYLLLGVWLSSAVLRGKIAYRPWSYIHLSTYPLVGFVWVHAWQVGSVLGEFGWMQVYWAVLGLVFVGVVLVRLLQLFNFGYARYRVVANKLLADDIVELEVAPVKDAIVPSVGQFVYMKLETFGESHPFTAMSFDEKTGNMKFGIKMIGKFTKSIRNIALGSVVLLDGPYGVFTKEGHADNPKIIVAGGVGITPFVELVQRFANDNTILFNCNRKLECAIYRNELKSTLKHNYFDVISHEQVDEENAISAMINEQLLQEKIPDQLKSTGHFFVCGPVGFMDAVTNMLINSGVGKDRIYTERFSH